MLVLSVSVSMWYWKILSVEYSSHFYDLQQEILCGRLSSNQILKLSLKSDSLES